MKYNQEFFNPFVTIKISNILIDNTFFLDFSLVYSNEFESSLRQGQILLTKVDVFKQIIYVKTEFAL